MSWWRMTQISQSVWAQHVTTGIEHYLPAYRIKSPTSYIVKSDHNLMALFTEPLWVALLELIHTKYQKSAGLVDYKEL
jgi:hypothetical protein